MVKKNIIDRIQKLLNTIEIRIYRFYLSFCDNEQYARVKYKWRFGRELNLENPVLFSEKIQWLKIWDNHEEHARLADKYEVRRVVADKIGKKYLNELFFVSDNPDTIDFDSLPEAFVLKGNHGSGFNILCPDKNLLDWKRTKKKLRKWLNLDFAKRSRELHYGYIKRRIICEKFLSDDSGGLRDYKILCFNGVPKLIWVDEGRYTGHKRTFFSLDWQRLDVTFNKYPMSQDPIEKPVNLEEMITLASELSSDFPFVRIDFYSVDGKTIFSEITFHPASGFAEFKPIEFSREVASWIKLPEINRVAQ